MIDGNQAYRITKPNGKIKCSCAELKLAPIGPCEHINQLRDLFKNGDGNVNASKNGRRSAVTSFPQPVTGALPEIRKSSVALDLEYPFRPDQIKKKNGLAYIDGASVIQRLNDVLGTENWSFELVSEPVTVEGEKIAHGRLTVTIGTEKVVREDIGFHELIRRRSGEILSEGDTVQAAIKDCIKRCAHQLGVGLHLYSQDGTYQSFTPNPE